MSKKKKKSHIPFRINVLFFVVFLLFSALILQLGVLQIVQGESYRKQLERTESVTANIPVPRGKMFDRNLQVLVDNKPVNTITYTRLPGATQKERLAVAKKLAQYIDKNTSKVTERDKKDYWILTRPKQAAKKLTAEDQKKLKDDQLYQLQLDRITSQDLNDISAEELKVLAIKREMDSGYALTPQNVKKEGVTDREYAVVSEHLEELPGVNTTTDWQRQYPNGELFKNYIGTVTSEERGIPRQELDYYLSRGYSRNDRVGVSYLEKQYEDVLSGQKEKVTNVTDRSGNLLETNIVQKGQRGQDLILTIDIALQKRVEQIIEDEMLKARQKFPGQNKYLDEALVVMMNPNTGEIYSLAGKKYTKNDKGKRVFIDYASANTNNAYVVGSAVKGATILTGYQTGVIQPGTVMLDTPLKIKSTQPLKSWKNLGYIDDLTALERSSNVYMFRTAMLLGGYDYQFNQAAAFTNPGALDTLRNSFSQFGLGVKTGIDLPVESNGYTGTERKIFSLMYLAIGQYDSYTPMQLAQYVSTIANGGYRVQPHLLKEIRQPANEKTRLGKLLYEFEPNILNRVDMKKEYIERVQEGFRQVMQEPLGTGYAYFNSAPYKPAGKTGTAQTFFFEKGHPKYGDPTLNLTLVGYAPNDQPEIAFSVVVPNATEDYGINKYIGRRILDAYFDLKKERYQNKTN